MSETLWVNIDGVDQELEAGGFRLYHRTVGSWRPVYELDAEGKPVMEEYTYTQSAWHNRPEQRVHVTRQKPPICWEFRAETKEWQWHMRKTYSKIGPAKAAYRYHYRQGDIAVTVAPQDGDRSPTARYGACHEVKIVPVVTIELEPIEFPR